MPTLEDTSLSDGRPSGALEAPPDLRSRHPGFRFFVADGPAPASAKAPGRSILCMVDGPGASWQINFARPLANLRAEGAVALTIFEDRPIDGVPAAGWTQRLEALLDDVEPAVVVLSRCYGPLVEAMLGVCRAAGIPTVYHLDDDLLFIPENLGSSKFRFYRSPLRRNRIIVALGTADLVYFSNAALHHRIGRFGLTTASVYGAISSAADPPFQPYSPKLPLTVGYMGTSGHRADLNSIVPAIAALMSEKPEIRFEVFGSLELPDALVREFPDRTGYIPAEMDYGRFLARLSRLGWAVGLAPLRSIPVNAVKTNTKFVEYSTAGIPMIASAGQVYDADIRSGCALECREAGDWHKAMAQLLDSAETAAGLVAKAQERLVAEYDMPRLLRQVLGVVGSAAEARQKSSSHGRVQ